MAGSSGWCLRPQETQWHQPGFQRESPQGSLRAGERASLGWKTEAVKNIRPLSTGSPTWGAVFFFFFLSLFSQPRNSKTSLPPPIPQKSKTHVYLSWGSERSRWWSLKKALECPELGAGGWHRSLCTAQASWSTVPYKRLEASPLPGTKLMPCRTLHPERYLQWQILGLGGSLSLPPPQWLYTRLLLNNRLIYLARHESAALFLAELIRCFRNPRYTNGQPDTPSRLLTWARNNGESFWAGGQAPGPGGEL